MKQTGLFIEKQKEFIALGGNSQLHYPLLQSGLFGFIFYLPYAIDIAFFRPHFTETNNLAYWPAIAENFVFRFKTIFGEKVRSRLFDNQYVDLMVAAKIINKFNRLGMPKFIIC